MSSELEVRLKRHNEGGNKTTSAYAPFDLLYTKEFEIRAQEKYLKSGVGRLFLKSL